MITESSASVQFKVSEKSNNIYSVQCKPTVFGNRLSHTDLDVAFKINVNASNKKRNITFSISDGKVNETVTKYKKTEPRSSEVDHENDDDTLLTKPESYPELIIYSTITTILLKPKKMKRKSIDMLYHFQQQWFKEFVSKHKYKSVLEESEMFLTVENSIEISPMWIESFLLIGCNVTKFKEEVENLELVPVSDKPSWTVAGTSKVSEIVVKDVFANTVSQSSTIKRVLVRLSDDSDILAIDCTNTDVEEGHNQPITVIVNGGALRKIGQ